MMKFNLIILIYRVLRFNDIEYFVYRFKKICVCMSIVFLKILKHCRRNN